MGDAPRIGTSLARVEAAEEALRVSLPGPLRQTLTIANRFAFECAEEAWELHPVWDSDNPRRTASHIVHENQPEQRWPGMGDDLLVIARHFNTADRLVLRVVNGVARPELLFFDSESGETREVKMDVHMLYDLACAYARKVEHAGSRRRG